MKMGVTTEDYEEEEREEEWVTKQIEEEWLIEWTKRRLIDILIEYKV